MPTLLTMPGKRPLSIDAHLSLKAYRARTESDVAVTQALARQSMEPVG